MVDDPGNLIESLESEWRDALCARDLDRLRALMHPKFILIGARGGSTFRMNREEWLDAIQKRDVADIDLRVKDAAIFDESMVGTIEARWRVNYLGKQIEDCVLLTDVWVCVDGRWQAVRRHSSPLPHEECVGGAATKGGRK